MSYTWGQGLWRLTLRKWKWISLFCYLFIFIRLVSLVTLFHTQHMQARVCFCSFFLGLRYDTSASDFRNTHGNIIKYQRGDTWWCSWLVISQKTCNWPKSVLRPLQHSQSSNMVATPPPGGRDWKLRVIPNKRRLFCSADWVLLRTWFNWRRSRNSHTVSR